MLRYERYGERRTVFVGYLSKIVGKPRMLLPWPSIMKSIVSDKVYRVFVAEDYGSSRLLIVKPG